MSFIFLSLFFFLPQLLQGSPEMIEPSFFTADWHVVLLSSGGNMLLPDDRKGKESNKTSVVAYIFLMKCMVSKQKEVLLKDLSLKTVKLC